MLAWHIFETTSALEFYGGKIVDKINVHSLLELEEKSELMDCERIYLEEAKKLKPTDEMVIGVREMHDEPFSIPVEIALWLEQFDWEGGSVKGSLQHAVFLVPESFEEVQALYSESWLEVELFDLRFNLTFIEMLAPNAPAPPLDLLSVQEAMPKRREGGPGRRRKHDWDNAFMALIAKAGREPLVADPNALGAQAEIANRLADWFAEQGSDIPAHSLLQEKAGDILKKIKAVTS
jgi:hypothetical protein